MSITTEQHAELIDIVRRAGDAILEVYRQDFDVISKADESPLTQADLAAHEIILSGLTELTPQIPLISEESAPPDYEQRRQWQRYWLIDPLDGTKEFVNRNGEFTVNIALIEHGEPVLGVVGVPVQQLVYIGDTRSGSAHCLQTSGADMIHAREMDAARELVVVASRSHGGERLEGFLHRLEGAYPELARQPVGSSLKLCVLAQGQADVYPRLGPTSEWDIAAAHAVLRAAGGEVRTFDGSTLRYNTKESLLNPEFYAVADAQYDWQTLFAELYREVGGES